MRSLLTGLLITGAAVHFLCSPQTEATQKASELLRKDAQVTAQLSEAFVQVMNERSPGGEAPVSALSRLEAEVDSPENRNGRNLEHVFSASPVGMKLRRILLAQDRSYEDRTHLRERYLADFKKDPEQVTTEIQSAMQRLELKGFSREKSALLEIAGNLPEQKRAIASIASIVLTSPIELAAASRRGNLQELRLAQLAYSSYLSAAPSEGEALAQTVEMLVHQPDGPVWNILIDQFSSRYPEGAVELQREASRLRAR